MEVNLYEAKTKLSSLIERAVAGEEIIIAKAGKPMVKLVRIKCQGKRKLGTAAGMIGYKPGWDAAMTDAELDSLLGGSGE